MPHATVLPTDDRARRGRSTTCCTNRDTLSVTPGPHTSTVAGAADHLDLIVGTTARDLSCQACGTLAAGHGRNAVELVDASCFEFSVDPHWRKRRLVRPDRHCPVSTFSEVDSIADASVPLWCRLTCRTVLWAVERLRRDHASINALTWQPPVSWHTAGGASGAVVLRLRRQPV